MPVSLNAYARLVAIDRCLQTGRYHSLDQLADACEIHTRSRPSHRTLEADIRILRYRFGAPVPKATRPEGRVRCYKYDEKGWSFLNEQVTLDELILLKEIRQLLHNFHSLPLASRLEDVINKLDAIYESFEFEAEQCIEPESTPRQRGIDFMHPVFKAIHQRQVLELDYKPFDLPERHLAVSPYLLKENRKRWYIIGRDHADGRIINLAFDRILNIKPSDKNYLPRGDFDPHRYFKDVIGISRPYDQQAEKVLIEMDEEAAQYWITKPIHASQEYRKTEDGQVLFSFFLIPNKELKAELGRMAPHVSILEPQWLREKFSYEIGRWLDRLQS